MQKHIEKLKENMTESEAESIESESVEPDGTNDELLEYYKDMTLQLQKRLAESTNKLKDA